MLPDWRNSSKTTLSWGFGPPEAVKHAVVQFTDDLEQRIRGKAPEASPSVTVDELVHILQRYAAQKRPSHEASEATRKPRS